MRELIKVLKPEFIFTQLEASSDSELLSFLANNFYEKGIVGEGFKEAVLQREKAFPTGLPTAGTGVAIPHAEAEYVKENQVAIATLTAPVSFHMMGTHEANVYVTVVFLLALDKAESHLAILKELMQVIQDPVLVKNLSTAGTPQEVITLIQSMEGDR